jgi:hypothetical protein
MGEEGQGRKEKELMKGPQLLAFTSFPLMTLDLKFSGVSSSAASCCANFDSQTNTNVSAARTKKERLVRPAMIASKNRLRPVI